MIYESLHESAGGLQKVGIVTGLALVLAHLVALLRPDPVQKLLASLPRHRVAGTVVLAIALLWTYAIMAGVEIGGLRLEAIHLGEFYPARKFILLLIPITFILVSLFVEEFLFVRATGLLLLQMGAVLLDAVFLKFPPGRTLVPLLAYGWIVAGMFWVGMPYLMRDQIRWVSASPGRWKAACGLGAAYGLVMLVCAFAFWGNQPG